MYSKKKIINKNRRRSWLWLEYSNWLTDSGHKIFSTFYFSQIVRYTITTMLKKKKTFLDARSRYKYFFLNKNHEGPVL